MSWLGGYEFQALHKFSNIREALALAPKGLYFSNRDSAIHLGNYLDNYPQEVYGPICGGGSMDLFRTPRIWLIVVLSLFLTRVSPLSSQVNVTTQHNDNARTGQNTSETTLTLSNVNAGSFGLLAKATVDGQIYAQPLVLSNVAIGGGTHNVVYVATEHDSVYALDANTGVQYWKTSLFPSGSGATTVPSGHATGSGCNDISPEYGITSTPVIDSVTGTLYVVGNTYEGGHYYYRLHALSVKTGAELSGSPVIIKDSGGLLNAQTQSQRTALLLTNGHLIFGFSAHCDYDNWYGLVFSYKESTLALENVFIPVPPAQGSHAGVWMGGDGIAADKSGNLYFTTGNGNYDGVTSFGDSIIKLPPPPASGTWKPLDWYTPSNWDDMEDSDLDLGSGGVVLLPDLPTGTAHYQRLAQAGKDSNPSKISIADRNNLGHNCCGPNGPDTNLVQEITSQIAGGMFGAPSYWNGYIYFGGSGDYVKAFSFNLTTGAVSDTPVDQSSTPCGGANHQSCTTSVSSSGTSNGIVWALDSGTGTLYAFDTLGLGANLYSSAQVPARDFLAGGVKFLAPTIANGKVYVGANAYAGSNSMLGIYGLNPAPPPAWSGQASTQYIGGCGLENPSSTPSVSIKQASQNSLNWTITVSWPGGYFTTWNAFTWQLSDLKGTVGQGSGKWYQGYPIPVNTSRVTVGEPTANITVTGDALSSLGDVHPCNWSTSIPLQ